MALKKYSRIVISCLRERGFMQDRGIILEILLSLLDEIVDREFREKELKIMLRDGTSIKIVVEIGERKEVLRLVSNGYSTTQE